MTQIRDPELPRKRDDYEEVVQACKSACSEMEKSMTELNRQRILSTQLIEDVTDLINSIAYHPKHFDSSIVEVKRNAVELTDVQELELQEFRETLKLLDEAIARTMTMTITAAMAGALLRTIKQPGPLPTALAAGIISFTVFAARTSRSRSKFKKAKHDELAHIKWITNRLMTAKADIDSLATKTSSLRESLAETYEQCTSFREVNFINLNTSAQYLLTSLVNQVTSLCVLLNQHINVESENSGE